MFSFSASSPRPRLWGSPPALPVPVRCRRLLLRQPIPRNPIRRRLWCRHRLRQGVRSRSCLSAERRHFSSPRKKHFYFTKSFPNGIIGCVEQGFYKNITRSPVSGDLVIRCCSDLMFPPKRDFILKKSLFLDGVHVQMINLFIKKFTHRLSALPQPYCSLSESPLSSLLSTCQPCSCPAAWFFSQPPTWYHPLQAFSQKG